MEDYYWLNKDSRTFLKRGYLSDDETPEQRIRTICETAEKFLNIKGFADKFESYLKKGWYSLASPIFSNFGKARGLPISCYNSHIEDTIESILYTQAEVGCMSKYGGGTSAYYGDIRPRGSVISTGGASTGSVHFAELNDKVTSIISQSNVRRGSFAGYWPIDHGDIEEVLKIKGEGHPIQNMSFGVCITNKWMQEMIGGDKVRRKIWSKVVQKRFESGYPYIFFTDNVNDVRHKALKDKGLLINSSNLCSEICNVSNKDWSFVCDVSSINLLHIDQWKDTDAPQTLLFFLDAVMEEFIEKASNIKFMNRAVAFAKANRAIGIGVLGWHSLLQSKMIPFESMDAKYLNCEIFQDLNNKTLEASKELAKLYGEPEVLKGYGERNITRMAIAPTTSSSFILGQVSPSTEALNSNYFVKDLAKGKFTYRNPYLKEVLKSYGKDNEEVWRDILNHGGSVQKLEFLTKNEKDVFKTFGEISQKEIIIQAAQRQKYIDQSQSLNIMIDSKVSPKDVSQLMIFAWEQKIKTLYYQRGTNPAQENSRSILNCTSCES